MPTPRVPQAAAVADALVRLGRVPRVAPSAIRRLAPGTPIAGPAVPCWHSGTSLRAQLEFDRYLERRAADPSYDFRRHLRESGGAIET